MGDRIVQYRWWIILAWVAGVVALALLAPKDAGEDDSEGFLPPEAPYRKAMAALRESFPGRQGLSEASIVFERRDGRLTEEDRKVIEAFAEAVRAESERPGDLNAAGVQSPASVDPARFRMSAALRRLPLFSAVDQSMMASELARLPNPMLSPVSDEGQAALVSVQIPANYITAQSDRAVRRLREILRAQPLPAGLNAAVTGSSGFGSDYALATRRSNDRTMFVTILAVIVILLLVYRAPLAAAAPLVAISMAVVAALSILHLLGFLGLRTGTAEVIFVVVLVYGAGTDYSVLFISRYREHLTAGRTAPHAVAAAADATRPAILASGGTDAAGLLMLVFARFGIFRSTGPAVAASLVVALLAVTTLLPALLAVLGRRVFWPAGLQPKPRRQAKFWPAVARLVTGRAWVVLLVTLAALAVPAVRGANQRWVYDTLAMLKSEYGAARGLEMARRHWPVGEIAPVRLLVRYSRPLEEGEVLRASQAVTGAARGAGGVSDVRSYSQPLGKGPSLTANIALIKLGRKRIEEEYLSPDRRAIQFSVILKDRPFSLEAMENVQRLTGAVRQAAAQGVPDAEAEVFVAGPTAEMIDIRSVTRSDFRRVAALALAVIFLIVLALLRDVLLAAFMTASTVLSYLATLGITYWVFTLLLGAQGLDWKVEVLLFVVMIAVGVDYNIFLTARFGQESIACEPREALRRAVIHTGPVISSCGLIMACTLGSLMAGDLVLLEQLGFALGLGMLLDTFITRPLLAPAFIAATGRRGRAALTH